MSHIGIRADAGQGVGSGHVMRTLAIAQALLKMGHHVTYFSASLPTALQDRLKREGVAIWKLESLEVSETFEACKSNNVSGLIIDHYALDEVWRERIAQLGCPIMALDDLAEWPALHAQLVLNPGRRATQMPYKTIAPNAQHLLGPDYALVRDDILQYRDKIQWPRPARIFMAFGGADGRKLSSRLPAALTPCLPDDVKIDLVVTQLISDQQDFRHLSDQVRIHTDVDNMGALIQNCRLAVIAGGNTLAEVAVLRVPSVIIMVADNQVPSSMQAQQDGWALAFDLRSDHEQDHTSCPEKLMDHLAAKILDVWGDESALTTMFENTASLLDGNGAHRAAKALCALMNEDGL